MYINYKMRYVDDHLDVTFLGCSWYLHVSPMTPWLPSETRRPVTVVYSHPTRAHPRELQPGVERKVDE